MPANDFPNYQPAKCCKTCKLGRLCLYTAQRICSEKYIVDDAFVCDSWEEAELVFYWQPQALIESVILQNEGEDYFYGYR